MSGHYIRKRTRLGSWSWAIASFAAMLLLTGILFFRLAVVDVQGLTLTILVVAGLVALALLLSLVAITKAWRRGYRGGGRAVAGFALASIVAVPLAIGVSLALEHPTSSMAETDGLAEASPIAGAGQAPASSSLLLGRSFPATAADVYSAARATAEAGGWDIVEVEASALPQPAEGDLGVSGTVLVPVPTLRETLNREEPDEAVDPYAASDSDTYTITAVAYAPILGLPSDVTIRIAEVDGTSFVDLRSVSRDLTRDLGQNRRFIEGFLSRLEAAISLLQSGPGATET